MRVMSYSCVFTVFASKSGGVKPSIGGAATLNICSKFGY